MCLKRLFTKAWLDFFSLMTREMVGHVWTGNDSVNVNHNPAIHPIVWIWNASYENLIEIGANTAVNFD